MHARTHVHYETGDHVAGRDWLDGWISGPGRTADNLAHYSWHAALHELSMGDFGAVRDRYAHQLSPPAVVGCRALVDSCSLLWRWAITPGASDVPEVDGVLDTIDEHLLDAPPTPFMALHSAVTLCALGEGDRLARLDDWSRGQAEPTYGEVVSPLCSALRALADGDASTAADRLAAMIATVGRLGGSDAQREVVEDTLIAALLAAGRYDEALPVIDRRLDRRQSPRDEAFRSVAGVGVGTGAASRRAEPDDGCGRSRSGVDATADRLAPKESLRRLQAEPSAATRLGVRSRSRRRGGHPAMGVKGCSGQARTMLPPSSLTGFLGSGAGAGPAVHAAVLDRVHAAVARAVDGAVADAW